MVIRFSFAALIASLALLLQPNPADACGGLVCSMAAPVIQDAEQIIFSDNGDGTITAIIQIMYSGDAERFAWVLPVPGAPEIGVSSDLAFQRLREQTDPRYRLERSVEGTCDTPPPPPASDGGFGDTGAGGDAGVPSPEVVDSGTVGPYDYVTISLDPETDNPGDVAITFLSEGGYDVDETTRDVLGPYLASGMNLIAFRLTKNATTGSIRPIVMTYTSARAMIPIRPTALAAASDMGIRVWVLGEHRAVPANYRHVILNDARYDWLTNSGYMSLVGEAVDEAGGRAFVTELADSTETIMPSVFSERDEFVDSGADGFELIREVVDQYFFFEGPGLRVSDGLLDVINAHAELEEGMTATSYIEQVKSRFSFPDPIDFDRDAFIEDVQNGIVMPLRMTQLVLDRRPYLTRMVTTMSPEEMTVDPEFALNADLPDVSNVHTATFVRECSSLFYFGEAPWRLTLPGDLGVVHGQFGVYPHTNSEEIPAALRIEQLGPSGPAMVVEDRRMSVRTAISAASAAFVPEIPERGTPSDAGTGRDSSTADASTTEAGTDSDAGGRAAVSGGACSATGDASSWAWLLLGLVFVRRRRTWR